MNYRNTLCHFPQKVTILQIFCEGEMTKANKKILKNYFEIFI